MIEVTRALLGWRNRLVVNLWLVFEIGSAAVNSSYLLVWNGVRNYTLRLTEVTRRLRAVLQLLRRLRMALISARLEKQAMV